MPLKAAVDRWMIDAYIEPWRAYFQEKKRRGELVRIGDIWVDVPNVVDRPFTCESTSCSPGLRRRGAESCCAEFFVEITEKEVRALARVFEGVSGYLEARDPDWAKRRPSLEDCIVPHDDNRFQRALAKRKRRCTFTPPLGCLESALAWSFACWLRCVLGTMRRHRACGTPCQRTKSRRDHRINATDRRCSFLDDRGAIRCGIHGWALEAGVDVFSVKPKLCFLFPLLVQDLQDGTFLITVLDGENGDLVGFTSFKELPCLQGERTFGFLEAGARPFYEDHRATLRYLFGERLLKGLDALFTERHGAFVVPLWRRARGDGQKAQAAHRRPS